MEVNPNFSDKAKRDYALIQQAISGDQRAFASLLAIYRDSIYYMLLKMVSNKSDAEDLTIETFGKAFKNIQFYTPNFAFSTWLFKIGTNNCIDFLRKKKQMQKMVQIDSAGAESAHETFSGLHSNLPDPEENMIIQQKEKLMQTIVKKLNPRYRKLVELRYFKELSYEEIATELQIPLGTVKARLFRSRILLLNTLKEADEAF